MTPPVALTCPACDSRIDVDPTKTIVAWWPPIPGRHPHHLAHAGTVGGRCPNCRQRFARPSSARVLHLIATAGARVIGPPIVDRPDLPAIHIDDLDPDAVTHAAERITREAAA